MGLEGWVRSQPKLYRRTRKLTRKGQVQGRKRAGSVMDTALGHDPFRKGRVLLLLGADFLHFLPAPHG